MDNNTRSKGICQLSAPWNWVGFFLWVINLKAWKPVSGNFWPHPAHTYFYSFFEKKINYKCIGNLIASQIRLNLPPWWSLVNHHSICQTDAKPVQNTIKLFVSKSCQISRGLALMNNNLNIELKILWIIRLNLRLVICISPETCGTYRIQFQLFFITHRCSEK